MATINEVKRAFGPQAAAQPSRVQAAAAEAARKAALRDIEAKKGNSGDKICVGCKLPNGFMLDLTGPGQPAQQIRLKGSNASNVIGGYGITENVDKQFFDEWLKRHKDQPYVTNGLIFVQSDVASARDQAADMADVTNGMEPMSQDKPGEKLGLAPGQKLSKFEQDE